MRQVIRGRAYDTSTATEIARGDYGDDGDTFGSDACWVLYQTEGGAFFEASCDHDGAPLPIQPLSKKNAKRWLQSNAPQLVEKYFGVVPEATAFGSNTTQTSANDAIQTEEIRPTATPATPSAASQKNELLILRPTIWGIGIDLKEALRLLSRWWQR